MNFYNENDPKAAAWLRQLITAGLIPPGTVDERSIADIKPNELNGFTQCHFFAGIAGWPLALQLAGWPASQPVGTGSCPCQPFSAAGKQLGKSDPRHLWPVFFSLIKRCRDLGQQWAFTIFGEQVANAIGKGWLDEISADLEGENYACGAAVLGAHSVGASNVRQRLYWVADSQSKRGCGGVSLEGWRCAESGGSGSNICFEPWPDGRGGSSTLSVSDVLSPPHGIPGRVGLLRGYGNAIVPQVAAEFIGAYLDCMEARP